VLAAAAAQGSAFPEWQPHLEIWVLIAGILGLGLYAARVIQPTVVAQGGAPISAAQKRWFVAGLALMWLASDWPIHDIAEERLYSVHMFQHLLYTTAIPPMFLLATPSWLGRLILGEGGVKRWFTRWARPVPAAITFNVVVAITHWGWMVNSSVRSGPVHYGVHIIVIGAALLAWTPVCGPFPEMRISPPGQMVHIFLLSIIPTIPAAFLVNAEGTLYSAYDRDPRLWGLSVTEDQQLAGAMMKVVNGFLLWGIILVIFIRWSRDEDRGQPEFRGRLVPSQPDGDTFPDPVSEPAPAPETGRTPGTVKVPSETT